MQARPYCETMKQTLHQSQVHSIGSVYVVQKIINMHLYKGLIEDRGLVKIICVISTLRCKLKELMWCISQCNIKWVGGVRVKRTLIV